GATGGAIQTGENGIGHERIFRGGKGHAAGYPEGWDPGGALWRPECSLQQVRERSDQSTEQPVVDGAEIHHGKIWQGTDDASVRGGRQSLSHEDRCERGQGYGDSGNCGLRHMQQDGSANLEQGECRVPVSERIPGERSCRWGRRYHRTSADDQQRGRAAGPRRRPTAGRRSGRAAARWSASRSGSRSTAAASGATGACRTGEHREGNDSGSSRSSHGPTRQESESRVQTDLCVQGSESDFPERESQRRTVRVSPIALAMLQGLCRGMETRTPFTPESGKNAACA